MGGIIKEVLVPEMGHHDADQSAVAAHPIELADDPEIHLRARPEVLQHMDHLNAIDAVNGPRPGKHLEVVANIWVAVLINIHIALNRIVATAEVELQQIHGRLSASASR